EGCPTQDTACLAIKPAHPTGFDWFGFLDRGYRVTGTGNSDSHRASLQEVGYPRTYINVGSDDPAALTDSALLTAMRGMKAVISGGPFLLTSVGAVGPGGQVKADGACNCVHLHVDVQAPPWM